MKRDADDVRLNRLGWLLHAGGAVGTLALVCGIQLAVLSSLRMQAKYLRTRITEQSDYVGQASRIHIETAQLKQQVGHQQARLQEARAKVPDQPQESEFLGELAELAEACDVAITDYQPMRPQAEGGHFSIVVRVNFTAGYENICRFLVGLGELSRLCLVQDLSIKVMDPDSGEYPVVLGLKIYFTSGGAAPEIKVANG